MVVDTHPGQRINGCFRATGKAIEDHTEGVFYGEGKPLRQCLRVFVIPIDVAASDEICQISGHGPGKIIMHPGKGSSAMW